MYRWNYLGLCRVQVHWGEIVPNIKCRLRELAMASFPKAQLKRFNDVEPHGPTRSEHKLGLTPYSDREVKGRESMSSSLLTDMDE